MLHEVAVEIPANTPAASPAEATALLNRGVVTGVQVQIPSGCMGLARAQIWRGASQIWPSTPGAYFSGDGDVIRWFDDYEMADEPLFFTIRAWNIDDTYSHTLTFRFELVSLVLAEQRRGLPALIQRIGEVLLGKG